MSLPADARIQVFVMVRDRTKGRRFYDETLRLPLRSEDPFGVVYDLGHGAELRLTPVASHAPSPHPVCGWTVDDIRGAMRALKAKGVDFIIYEGMGQDADGVWTDPTGRAQIAFFADDDGNLLSLKQES